MKRQIKVGVGLLLGMALLLFPFIFSKYHVHLLTEIMIVSTFAISFYLLLGHTGLMSFGHGAYFGIGAYLTALSLVHFPRCHVLLAMLIGSLCAFLAGLIIGLLIVRLTRMYFALGTLAFGQMFWAIAWKWRGLTRGDDGLVGWSSRGIFLPLVGNFNLTNIPFMYYFISIIAVTSILLCWLFIRTPIGNTLTSLKSNADRAQFIGVNVHLAKLIVFSFSAFIAGISGSLYALFEKGVSPGLLDMFTSFEVVLISVIGGYSNFIGPIIGAFFYVSMTQYLSSITDKWQFIMGSLFVLIILFYPKGLIGMLGDLYNTSYFLKRLLIWNRIISCK